MSCSLLLSRGLNQKKNLILIKVLYGSGLARKLFYHAFINSVFEHLNLQQTSKVLKLLYLLSPQSSTSYRKTIVKDKSK